MIEGWKRGEGPFAGNKGNKDPLRSGDKGDKRNDKYELDVEKTIATAKAAARPSCPSTDVDNDERQSPTGRDKNFVVPITQLRLNGRGFICTFWREYYVGAGHEQHTSNNHYSVTSPSVNSVTIANSGFPIPASLPEYFTVTAGQRLVAVAPTTSTATLVVSECG